MANELTSLMLGANGSGARVSVLHSAALNSLSLSHILPLCSQRSSTATAAGWTWVSAARPASTTTTASSISSTPTIAGFTWSLTNAFTFKASCVLVSTSTPQQTLYGNTEFSFIQSCHFLNSVLNSQNFRFTRCFVNPQYNILQSHPHFIPREIFCMYCICSRNLNTNEKHYPVVTHQIG